VAYLKFAENDMGHASDSTPLEEQVAIVTAVNAIEQSPFWRDTAITTYADSEGIERGWVSRLAVITALALSDRRSAWSWFAARLQWHLAHRNCSAKKRAHPYAHLACFVRRLPHRRGYQCQAR
jgi:hypothetical protein